MKKEVGFLIVLIFVAVVIRIVGVLSFGDFWVDDLWSIYYSLKSFPFGIIEGLNSEDVHMPLFFLILGVWIKCFGLGEIALRMLPCIFSIAGVVAVYYTSKKLLGEKTAVIAASMIAVSAFHAHYARDIKFYSLVFLIAVLANYFYIRLLKNGSLKNAVLYSATSLVLIYTFNIGISFVFIQVVCGFFSLRKDKDKLKNFAYTGLAVLAFSIPAVLFIFSRFDILKGLFINSFAQFETDINFLQVVFQDWYTNNVTAIISNYKSGYSLIDCFKSFSGITTIIIPLSIGIFGLFKAILSKNKIINQTVFPSVIFLTVSVAAGAMGYLWIFPRYTMIIFPMFVMASAYGLSLIENKKIFTCAVAAILGINLAYLVLSPDSIVKLGVNGYSTVANTFKQININKKDVVFSPISGNLLQIYWKNSTNVDFSMEKFYLHKDYMKIIFDEEIAYKMTKENFNKYFREYIKTELPSKNLETFLDKNYIQKMTPDSRFVLLVLNKSHLERKGNIANEFVAKVFKDTKYILNKKLRYEKTIEFKDLNCEAEIYVKKEN